jgi:hypothetical protein
MRALFVFMVLAVSAVGCGGCGGQCMSLAGVGGRTCVPDAGVAPAGQALTLQIVSPGNTGCTTVESECVVTVDGGNVHLELKGTSCEPVGPQVCDDVLRQDRKPCAVPALAEGDYSVTSPAQTPLLLRVRDGGVASCTATFF